MDDIRIVECEPPRMPQEPQPFDEWDGWEPDEDEPPEDESSDFDEEWPTGPKIILGV